MKLEDLSDKELNIAFAVALMNRPVDEQTGQYWHDDDTTPEDDNHEWKSLPDFVNDWGEVRRYLVKSKIIVPPDFVKRTPRERNRRVMITLIESVKYVSP